MMMALLIAWLAGASMLAQATAPAVTDTPIQLAQTLGVSCRTEFGVCPIPPQPISSVCFCGISQGVTE